MLFTPVTNFERHLFQETLILGNIIVNGIPFCITACAKFFFFFIYDYLTLKSQFLFLRIKFIQYSSFQGRQLNGIHFAMEFLELSQKHQMGSYNLPKLDVTGKHVIIIGGGDTGVDCIGTAVRQVITFIILYHRSCHKWLIMLHWIPFMPVLLELAAQVLHVRYHHLSLLEGFACFSDIPKA